MRCMVAMSVCWAGSSVWLAGLQSLDVGLALLGV